MVRKRLRLLELAVYRYSLSLWWQPDTYFGARKLGPSRYALDFWRVSVYAEWY